MLHDEKETNTKWYFSIKIIWNLYLTKNRRILSGLNSNFFCNLDMSSGIWQRLSLPVVAPTMSISPNVRTHPLSGSRPNTGPAASIARVNFSAGETSSSLLRAGSGSWPGPCTWVNWLCSTVRSPLGRSIPAGAAFGAAAAGLRDSCGSRSYRGSACSRRGVCGEQYQSKVGRKM